MNINIPSSSLSDSALKCHLFHHVAALFLKTVRAAACLEVKLAATHFSPQQASNGPGVLGHDNCLWPQRYFGLHAALGFQYMSLTMLMVVIVSVLIWDNDSKQPLQENWDHIFDIHIFLVFAQVIFEHHKTKCKMTEICLNPGDEEVAVRVPSYPKMKSISDVAV